MILRIIQNISLRKEHKTWRCDKYNHKKPIAFCGYATGLLYKLALLFAGSWVGILLAFILLKKTDESAYKIVFAASTIPVLLALAMFFSVREKEETRAVKPREYFWKNMKGLNGRPEANVYCPG